MLNANARCNAHFSRRFNRNTWTIFLRNGLWFMSSLSFSLFIHHLIHWTLMWVLLEWVFGILFRFQWFDNFGELCWIFKHFCCLCVSLFCERFDSTSTIFNFTYSYFWLQTQCIIIYFLCFFLLHIMCPPAMCPSAHK